jgi:sulfite reductase alpha subunit-like flavoprotein
MVDSNDNGKISKKEQKAFKSIAGKDGEISRKEAKQALKNWQER